MHTRARGNFIALSGILVAAVLGAVTFFTWEFFGAAEQSSKPRIVYGASGTAYASSRPSRQNVVDHLSAAPLGENKGLKDPEVPAAEPAPDKAPELDRPEPPAQPRGDASVPRIITNSTEKNDICMSDGIMNAMKEIRQFMFDRVYTNPDIKSEEGKAETLVITLYDYYMNHPDKLPEENRRMIADGEKPEIAVCDYVGAMTDRFAILTYNDLFVPKSWEMI